MNTVPQSVPMVRALRAVHLVIAGASLGFCASTAMLASGLDQIGYQGSLFATLIAGTGILCVWNLRSWDLFSVDQADPIHEALDTFPEGVLVMDDRESTVLVNQAFCQMVAVDEACLLRRRVRRLPWVRSSSSRAGDFPWTRAIRERAPQSEQLMQIRLPSGETRILSINCSPVDTSGALCGAIVTFRDVTELEEYRAELQQTLALVKNDRDEISSKNRELTILATRDELTGCVNRRALVEAFSDLWHKPQRHGKILACLMVDNDHFKRVNDDYGHLVGDAVLQQVAKALMAAVPSAAILCRYGGEEFCVVLPETNAPQARLIAERMRENVQRIRLENHPQIRPTVSIGVSDVTFGATEPHQLIDQADQCLYIAKENGRNQVVVFESPLAATAALESRA